MVGWGGANADDSPESGAVFTLLVLCKPGEDLGQIVVVLRLKITKYNISKLLM
jgi:hypothetical protein